MKLLNFRCGQSARRTSILAVGFLVASVAVSGLHAQNMEMTEAEAEAEAPKNMEMIEEVVVTGFRDSLKRSLDLKRDAVGVVDAISAEDLGKFPDRHLGEALQRVPGVTLQRSQDSNGEGRRISVRGLPDAFVRTTLNGITAASSAVGDGANAARSFDFDIFATELFSEVHINKTPSANLAEGGLTATVNLQTPRPLDYANTQFVVSATGHYADISDDSKGVKAIDPRVALLYSTTWADGTWGAAVTMAYSDITNRSDWSQGFRWSDTGSAFLNNTLAGSSSDGTPITQADITRWGTTVNGSAATLAQLQDIAANTIAPLLPRVGPLVTDRKRLGATATLQFRPHDNFKITGDLLYATFDEDQYRTTIDGLTGFGRKNIIPRALTTANGALIGGTLDGGTLDGRNIGTLGQRTESVEGTFETEFMHFTLSTDWNITDNWTAFARVGYSASETDELTRTYLFQLNPVDDRLNDDATETTDATPNPVGSDRSASQYIFDLSNPKYPQFSGTNFNYLEPSHYRPGGFRFRPRTREDKESSLQFDLERVFDNSALSAISLGVRYADKKVSQERGERRDFETSELNFADYDANVQDFAPDFLKDAPSGTPTNFLIVDRAAGAGFLPKSLISTVPNDRLSTWTVKEETLAAYLKSDWNIPWGVAELGVRIVNTRQSSIGSQSVGKVFEPVTVINSYTDVLPSLNVRFDLEENIILRFAASKSVARPTLGQLSPGISVFPTTRAATAGNPNLEPFSATQFDLSLEWYFAGEGLLAATIFTKDISGFVIDGLTREVIIGTNLVDDDGANVSGEIFEVARPVNGADRTLTGLEVAYQQPFGNTGFGVLLNATLTDSKDVEADGIRRQLPGQSDLSYNAIGYYENYGFSARLAYSFRDDYLETVRQNVEERVDERGQLDVSLGYKFNDNLQVTVDAINITGEDFYSYYGSTSINRLFLDQEPVYIFGVRYQF